MINLLPSQEKRDRTREKDLKIILIIGAFILSGLAVIILSFLPIKFYLGNQVKYQETLIETRTAETSRIKLLDERTSKINNILSEFNDFYNQQFIVSALLDRLNNLLLPGVLLDSFSYNNEDRRVMVTGIASSVEEAYNLRNILREQDGLENLVFNLPDWMQAGEVNFRVEFNLEK